MWRDLSDGEKAELKTGRSQLYKGISLLEVLLVIMPVGFGIDNLVTLIQGGSTSALTGLIVDILLACLIIFGGRKLKSLLNSDAEKGELVCCEAEIVRLDCETIEARVISSVHRKTSIAYYAYVRPLEEPSVTYKVKTGIETHSAHKAGDIMLLVCSKDEIKEEYMQLLEVKRS